MRKSRIIFFSFVPPLLVLAVLIYLNLNSGISLQLFSSILYGIVISTFNFLLGLFSIKFGLEKSQKKFLIIVFGGLVLRLFITFSLIVIALKFLDVTLNSFIFTVFIFYFYYLMIEIFYLNSFKKMQIS